jgi:hypothetical protein
MAKKQIDEDDDFENDFENDDNDVVDYQDDNSDDEVSDDDGDILDIEDDGDIDIVIEIDEDDLDLTDSENEVIADEETAESGDDIILSKHKIEGKHSLKYDSIFKGKKEDPVSEDDMDGFAAYYKETIEVDKSSIYHHESIDNETYVRGKLVKERVYQVLKENTTINFLNNRRKPSRVDFNCYYSLLKENLKEESFTNIELFNELAVYFSDNLFNMFKLLDNSWRNLIINELQDHIGKNKNSKEITNRNIYIGTEIEFVWYDDIVEEEKLITGVVLETIYEESIFKVDSFEKIYMVEISDITKILNNTKFKYNLNKLNNIDFL